MAYSPKEIARRLEATVELTADVVLQAALLVEGGVRQEIVKRLDKDPTGALARSVTTTLASPTPPLRATVLIDRIYAEIQDQGGTIVPRRAKKLAVPLPALPRSMRGKSPRDWGPGELSLRVSKRGSAVLVDRAGRALYALVDRVVIPGTGYVAAGIEAAMPEIEALLAGAVEDGIG